MIAKWISGFIARRNQGGAVDGNLSDFLPDLVPYAKTALRGIWYRWSNGQAWNQLFVGTRCQFKRWRHMQIGRGVKIGHDVTLAASKPGSLVLGEACSIGAFSKVVVNTGLGLQSGHIRLGKYTSIGEYAYLGGAGGLEIGNDCIVGQYLSCHPENHVYQNTELPIRLQGVSRKGIRIGNDCWIGSKVTIVDGAQVGNHCIIAAGSVVLGNIPDYAVIGGVPAKILKMRNGVKTEI